MSTLAISADQIDHIRAHAASTYPEECCGILLGRLHREGEAITRTVVDLWPVNNAWGDEAKMAIAPLSHNPDQSPELSPDQNLTAERRYWIDPKELLAAQKVGRERDLQMIGIYHSHPDHPAVPSECDRVLAWPDYSYMIVSVPEGSATDVLSWALDEDQQFQSEIVQISGSLF
ncbi:MAG: M67 family metallopeptidase [Leptolyngbyaceae bacterium]|nr:M67 family metallopeptidase [Leptolyngbyaceae bacterium]